MESLVLEKRSAVAEMPVVAEAVVQVRKNPRPPPCDDPVELSRRYGAVAWHDRSRFVIVCRRRRR